MLDQELSLFAVNDGKKVLSVANFDNRIDKLKKLADIKAQEKSLK